MTETRADNPLRIPPSGWKSAALRVKDEIRVDHLPIIAAGMAFWAMLALFPSLIAAVSLYGLVADPAAVERQVDSLSQVLPNSAQEVVAAQMREIVQASGTGLGLGFLVSLVAAFWTASSGMSYAIRAINIAYDQEEQRGFVRLRGLALVLTVGGIALLLTVVTLIAVVPLVFGLVNLGDTARRVITWGRWPLMAATVMAALAVLYRYSPCRTTPSWKWVSVGAVSATLLWLAVTALFSVYVSNFGSYNETYGTIGGVIVLLLWLYGSSFMILLGAELNSELERQAGRLPPRELPGVDPPEQAPSMRESRA